MRGTGKHVMAGGMDGQPDQNLLAFMKPGDCMETAREYGEFSLLTARMPLALLSNHMLIYLPAVRLKHALGDISTKIESAKQRVWKFVIEVVLPNPVPP